MVGDAEKKPEATTKELAANADGRPMDGMMPARYSDKFQLAKILAKSGLIPKSLDTAEKVFIALQLGHELGLSPMIACNNITAINGKASLSADLIAALCRKHPDFAGMSIDAKPNGCTVKMRRRNGDAVDEFSYTFDEASAKTAGLLNKDGPWKQYPQRMFKARALAYCGRDAFPDVLAGLLSEAEAIDLEPEEPRVVSPPQDEEVHTARAQVLELLANPVFTLEQRKQYTNIVGTLMTTETLMVLAKRLEEEIKKKATAEVVPPVTIVADPPKVDEQGQQEIF